MFWVLISRFPNISGPGKTPPIQWRLDHDTEAKGNSPSGGMKDNACAMSSGTQAELLTCFFPLERIGKVERCGKDMAMVVLHRLDQCMCQSSPWQASNIQRQSLLMTPSPPNVTWREMTFQKQSLTNIDRQTPDKLANICTPSASMLRVSWCMVLLVDKHPARCPNHSTLSLWNRGSLTWGATKSDWNLWGIPSSSKSWT